jgi:N-acetylmuramoyl-L-alanine amidase
MSTDEYDAAAQAAAANRFDATIYIGFEASSKMRADVSYFAVPSFESVGGRSLGSHLVRELNGLLPTSPTLRGMRLFYVKRECRQFCVPLVQFVMSSTPRVR